MDSNLLKKRFPEDFPADVVDVLKEMSLTDLAGMKVLGSSSLRTQIYAGDYDAFEIVSGEGAREDVLKDFAGRLQTSIRRLLDRKNTFIGDIKAGAVEDWRVIPRDAKIVAGKVEGWNPIAVKAKLAELFEKRIISKPDFNKWSKLIRPTIDPLEFLELQKMIRPHILRWKPAEILAGRQVYRGQSIDLWEALGTPEITKVDVVAWVSGNRFTDFSCIYEFRIGDEVLNEGITNIEQSLKENIYLLAQQHKYFKMAKRMFALARATGDRAIVDKLSPIFNGDLGRLYLVGSDVGTLIFLFENEKDLPYEKIEFAIDQWKSRLSAVVFTDYLAKDETVSRIIDRLVSLKDSKASNASFLKLLQQLEEIISGIIHRGALVALKQRGLFPPPKKYLP